MLERFNNNSCLLATTSECDKAFNGLIDACLEIY